MKAWLVLLLLAPLAQAATFKCVDDKGKVTYQQTACSEGTQSKLALVDNGRGLGLRFVPGPSVPRRSPIGSTEQEVRLYLGNTPYEINRTTTAGGVREQWVIEDWQNRGRVYLYFNNGRLTSIQESPH